IGNTTGSWTLREAGRTIKVTHEDELYEIFVNGERTMKILNDDPTWEGTDIYDTDGEVVAHFKRDERTGVMMLWTGDEPPQPRVMRFGTGLPGLRSTSADNVQLLTERLANKPFFNVQADPPPVMMGVTMDTPSEALALHLGFDAADATLISSVVEGLPADKAGVQRYDIIIEVDGSGDANQAKIRSALRGKEAGDELELEVIRRGKARTLVLDLEAYDSEALNTSEGFLFYTEPRSEVHEQELAVLREQFDALGTELNELGAQIADPGLSNAERSEIGQEMGAIGGQMGQLGAQIARLESQNALLRWPGQMRIEIEGDGGARPLVIPTPTTPAPPASPSSEDAEERLREVEARLAETEERLQAQVRRLLEAMERIEENMEDERRNR
ncbi:MAG: PDZ domain-containing protein, partial [Planctomycetota bacterium]